MKRFLVRYLLFKPAAKLSNLVNGSILKGTYKLRSKRILRLAYELAVYSSFGKLPSNSMFRGEVSFKKGTRPYRN